MILLSNKILPENALFKYDDIKYNTTMVNIEDLAKDTSLFEYIYLMEIVKDEDFAFLENGLYVLAYEFDKVKENYIFIKNKVDLSNYIVEILKNILNNDLDIEITWYLNLFIEYNPKIKSKLLSNLELVMSAVKKDLQKSPSSIISVYNIVNLLPVRNINFFNELEDLIRKYIDPKEYIFDKEMLESLVKLSSIIKIDNLEDIKKDLNKLIEEEKWELPFETFEASQTSEI